MKDKKVHKIDIVFIIGLIIIGILSGMLDGFYWKDVESDTFPVFSCLGVFTSYAFWIILLICSSFKYKEVQDKPKYVRWFMYFPIPFLHIAFSLIGSIISSLIIYIFKL